MKKVNYELHERLVKLVSSMGYELLGCELAPQGRQVVFRVYIDRENGVSSDDCSKVSRQVSAMLDVEDIIKGQYTLEVSSPGIERPLFEIEHFRKYVGKRVRLRMSSAINGRRQFKGILQGVEGEDIYLLLDDADQAVKLPFPEIEKANLVEDIVF